MVELATRWDQSSTDPEMRKLALKKASELEADGRRVQEDSLRGLVRQRDENPDQEANSTWKKAKKGGGKIVDKILQELAEGMREDQEEIKELEKKQDKKHEELMKGITYLAGEIREQSEQRSHDAYLEREARKEELAMILEALRKDGEI